MRVEVEPRDPVTRPTMSNEIRARRSRMARALECPEAVVRR